MYIIGESILAKFMISMLYKLDPYQGSRLSVKGFTNAPKMSVCTLICKINFRVFQQFEKK
jgi:hypothetical protein